jgi:hypothetical protein
MEVNSCMCIHACAYWINISLLKITNGEKVIQKPNESLFMNET